MTQVRDSSVWLQIGAKRSGKTQGTLNIMADMHYRQGKGVLVLDVGSQPEYDQFPDWPIDRVKHWPGTGVYKVRDPEFDRSRAKRFFHDVNQYVRNSFIVFEDATTYLDDNVPIEVEKLIFNSRNRSNDYLFNVHSFSDCTPVLLRHCEYIILRRTADNPDKLPGKVPAIEKVRRAMREIEADNSRQSPGAEVPKIAYRVIDIHG